MFVDKRLLYIYGVPQTEFVEVAKLCTTLKIKGLENYSIGQRELQMGSYNKTTKNPLDLKAKQKIPEPPAMQAICRAIMY